MAPSEWRYWGKGAQPNSAGPLPATLLGPLVSHPSIDLYVCISESICALYAERTAMHTHAERYYVSGRNPRNATNHYFIPFMSMKMRSIL